MLDSLFFIVVAAIAATALLYRACDRLESCSHRLAERYAVPDIVKGSVITAIASSVPELATAVLAIPVHADFELGLSAIIGSAIFNILVIPACSVLAQRRALRSNRELIFREAQFYLVSVTTLLLVLSLAAIYNGSGPTDGGEPIYGTFTRGLAVIPLFLYGVYLFIQFEEVRDHRVRAEPDTGIDAGREWLTLAVCITIVVIGVEVLLRCAIALGELLDTPTFLWGLTVVAAATSIPDTLISVNAARAGRSDSSVSNVLGSNVFDLLVAVPVAVLLTGAVTVNFTQTVPMMGFLLLATIAMVVFMRRDMELTIAEALAMLGLYLVFGAWMTAEAFGFVDLLRLSG